MTTRLYYDDCGVTTFDAEVTSCIATPDGRFEVALTRTGFYPTSGGQPFDTGHLAGVPVVDVVDRGDDVIHVLTGALTPGTLVSGEINPDRRRDHREQHTGQHVLSAAFEQTCGAATVGFHMGVEVSTIDLAREVTAAEVDAAESDANRIVRDDRPVRVWVAPPEQVAGLGLRRAPARTGPLRVVDVEGFDRSACGGTHVDRTGAIGLVMVVGTEKVRGGTRLTFLCGARAVRGAFARRDVLAEVGRLLGVAPLDVAGHVARLQEGAREATRTITDLRVALTAYQAADWRAAAETIGPYRVVLRDSECDGAVLKGMAQAVVAGSGMVAILTGVGSPVPVVVARSADVVFDAGAFMKRATGRLGGRGGGRPELAQGGMMAPREAVLEFAREDLAGREAMHGQGS